MEIKEEVKLNMKRSITTEEYNNGAWLPVVNHTFYAGSGYEMKSVVTKHRKYDRFFDASFDGEIDGIYLRNKYG